MLHINRAFSGGGVKVSAATVRQAREETGSSSRPNAADKASVSHGVDAERQDNAGHRSEEEEETDEEGQEREEEEMEEEEEESGAGTTKKTVPGFPAR
ncbi:gem-associated protein 2-like [Sparus aurata]|uniref:gem-associated protein 2-like n=1 Tax=Sparus aurata TaxID=8175 RepID=UPI0011C124B1|nr:gem-associated protein 2-like [Sparus aurata]